MISSKGQGSATERSRNIFGRHIPVTRHSGSGKWYALIGDVAREKLGLDGCERVDILNVRCGPLLAGSLRTEPGYFPAYHMNKGNWISILLDGTVPPEQIAPLLEMSYDFAGKLPQKKRK